MNRREPTCQNVFSGRASALSDNGFGQANKSKWWMPWIDDDMDQDAEGNKYFEFASINALNIQTGQLKSSEVCIQPNKGWEPIESDYNPLLLQNQVARNELRISWPWANEIFKLPLPNILIYKPSNK